MESSKTSDTSEILTSLYRAMGVLEAFSFADELTLNEIVEKTGLPKTTAFRAVKTFLALDYLCYDPKNRKYTLSPKLFRLGFIAINARPLSRWARPLMEEVRNEFGEAVHLNIRSGDERMCIESLASTYQLQVDMPVGHRSPLYAGATAKVLLAAMSDEEIDSYIKRVSLVKLTEHTVVDTAKLWHDILDIRKFGHAMSVSERVKGVVSVSVPIYGNGDETVAALSVLIPTARSEDSDISRIRESLLQKAKELSRRLGGHQRATVHGGHA
ncbi:IclR family transcriptional regulator [Alicyclobacillus dauci]|uniref:IclR family transcriptional regulator n=1 Tax=Alicyclobacillus dauci TaxID=1475485 RepID=A0ABY6Z0H1_9BACL|nr:IclR family transcriptional regulator [Alicyclobacillus dauci]WAH36217.1 IclR family transcriptional regulator [Alicyclobacillus dauci]